MTERLLTCSAFDAMLSDYLEGTLDAAARAAAEQHVRSCTRCGALLADLHAIIHDARALPDLAPEHDLWTGIEARIEAPVVTLPAPRAPAPRVRRATLWLGAAAAALVAATAGITYVATTHFHDRAGPAVAAAPERSATPPAATPLSPAPRTVAARGSDPGARTGSPNALSTGPTARQVKAVRVEQVYDQEIARLNAIVRDQRSQLDTATVAVIERNLRIIDRAIAQSRAALAKDPGSRFLNDQLNSALDQKVELLRTVALLPTRT
jgi:hypothetical protein